MKNPFEYGGVVGGNAFCNREKEVTDLLRAIENNEKLLVFSERRYRKPLTFVERLRVER